MKALWLIVGVLLVVFGGVFTFQGLGYLGGSSMTGDTTWAVIGPILAVVGLVLVVLVVLVVLAVLGARRRLAFRKRPRRFRRSGQ